jgi:hypothetical protein
MAVPLRVDGLSSVAGPIHAIDSGFRDNPVISTAFPLVTKYWNGKPNCAFFGSRKT